MEKLKEIIRDLESKASLGEISMGYKELTEGNRDKDTASYNLGYSTACRDTAKHLKKLIEQIP